MPQDEDRQLRQQLIEARAKIEAQLHYLYCPADAGGAAGPPDFRREIAELRSELREIDALLNGSEETGA